MLLAVTMTIPANLAWARGGGGGGGGARGGAGGGGGGGMRAGGGGGPGAGGGGMRGGGGAGGGGGRPANPGMGHTGGGNQLGGAGRGEAGRGEPGRAEAGRGAGNRGPGSEGRGGNESGPGGNRGNAGAGNKAGVGNRPEVGNRTETGIGNRTNVGNRTNTVNNKSGNTFNRTGNNVASGNQVNVNHYGGWGNGAGYAHGYNNYWHHGYWHSGYWGWGPGWGGAAAWGLAGWGLGSLYYNSGYGGGYSNPYYVATPAYSGTAYDYSAPIQVAANTAPAQEQSANTDVAANDEEGPAPSPETAAALKLFDAARDAFKAGNYDEAQKQIEAALKQLPNDAALHEFRGLVQFAQGKYQEAAATVYAVLSVGPGWDWTTLSSMYDSIDTYTKQLRALETYRKAKPDSPDAAFLLAYHYLTAGHTDAAIKQFEAVVKLLPDDQLAPQLLSLLKANTGNGAGGEAPPAINPDSGDTPPADDAPPVDKSTLIGSWKAARGKSTAIQLKLNDNDTFVWTATQGGKSTPIEGTFSVEGNLLLLTQTSDGNTMAGKVTARPQGGFNFKMLGSPPTDTGLDFGR